MGLAEQARRLIRPHPPDREEELAEHVEMWQDKTRKLEAHGEDFKLSYLKSTHWDIDDRLSQRVF